jgi:hypothetical protein
MRTCQLCKTLAVCVQVEKWIHDRIFVTRLDGKAYHFTYSKPRLCIRQVMWR